jgi:hypothetical protein
MNYSDYNKGHLPMIVTRALYLLLAFAAGVSLQSQEIRYIDLTTVRQRTELRVPPAPPANCDSEGPCVSGGIGGASIGDGAPDARDPRALGITVLRVSPLDLYPKQPFEAEFRVLNTGRVDIDLPVSPHLSDLQPDDASLSFSYFSLALVAQIPAEPYAEVRSLALIQLYGSLDQKRSMITLRPGEWIRVKANLVLTTWPSKSSAGRVYGTLWLRKNTFRPHPGGSFTESQNLYPNVVQMSPETWLPVYVHSTPAEARQ